MRPDVKMVSGSISVDLSDEISALSAQSKLIEAAQERGHFGGNINQWY